MANDIKHAISLLWHKDFLQLKDLILSFDSNFYFYIHLDRKNHLENAQMKWLEKQPNIRGVYKKYRVNWGGFSLLKAELFLLKKAIHDQDIDYIHVMSAQDYPIKNISQIKNFFARKKGGEFVSYAKLPYSEWEDGTYRRFQYYIPYDLFALLGDRGIALQNLFVRIQAKLGCKRPIPNQYEYLYGGSNWMSITRACAEYIVHSYNRKFYNRLKHTIAPEETFFPTTILNSPFASKVVNNNLRYIVWDKRRKGHTKVLEQKDWASIIMSQALFARKFESKKSNILKSYINSYLLASESNIEDKHGIWLTETLTGHHYDPALGYAILQVLSYTSVKDIADFGCGPGWYTYFLYQHGYNINGYDGNPNVKEMSSKLFQDGFYCQCVDLTEELTVQEPFDMILCLEVGEHIPREYEDIFLQNLVRNAQSYILLSWAVPNQSGNGHVNCHSNEYVIEKMKALGFYVNIPVSQYLRKKASLSWFHNTIMFFQRE